MSRFVNIIISVLVCAFSFSSVNAQQKKRVNEDIFKDLAKKDGKGVVTIQQNPKMNLLINKKIKENSAKTNITYSGYRIQAFMDNNQKKSSDAAREREKKLKDKYPDLTTYVTFSSPFWKLRVGDFRTHADALVMVKKISTDFPELSTELLIVKDEEAQDVTLENK